MLRGSRSTHEAKLVLWQHFAAADLARARFLCTALPVALVTVSVLLVVELHMAVATPLYRRHLCMNSLSTPETHR